MWLVIAILDSKSLGFSGNERIQVKKEFHNPFTLSRDVDGTETYINVQNSDFE